MMLSCSDFAMSRCISIVFNCWAAAPTCVDDKDAERQQFSERACLQGIVYKGETSDGHFVALKKSRCSLSIKRSLLSHEAAVYAKLQGCPQILVVLGFARLEHFEYLALDLAGPSLSHRVGDGAFQMGAIVALSLQLVSGSLRDARCWCFLELSGVSFMHGQGSTLL
jgi:hypothetical protein